MKTEIFGTFGPACQEKETIEKMITAGMTGMRLNLSHTTLWEGRNYLEAYQQAAANMEIRPQILIDMQGPELRVGNLSEPLDLAQGEEIIFCHCALLEQIPTKKDSDKREEQILSQAVADAVHIQDQTDKFVNKKIIPVPVGVIKAVEQGDEILLDDGKICLKITRMENEIIYANVHRGGILRSHKSIKLVDKNVDLPPLTQHDIENIKYAKAFGVTALMQPFVRGKEDLIYVREVLKQHGAADVQIFAKIENRIGIEHLEEIIFEADVIIIARGDLGNDMPLWELPRVQKQIEAACHKADKPYIVVTQMLASMETNPVPTRAEVSDIFHAVYHGAWGVMLTGETAVGRYPVEAIRYLVNTAQEASAYRSII